MARVAHPASVEVDPLARGIDGTVAPAGATGTSTEGVQAASTAATAVQAPTSGDDPNRGTGPDPASEPADGTGDHGCTKCCNWAESRVENEDRLDVVPSPGSELRISRVCPGCR